MSRSFYVLFVIFIWYMFNKILSRGDLLGTLLGNPFFISINDANWNQIFGICLGCIWNHFGVTRALKYVPSTCDIIIVVLISSGHICTNHAWINPTLWFISILISFLFRSIVIQYKKALKSYCNYFWVPNTGLCVFYLLGTLWSSQRFSCHIYFWRRYISKVDFQVMLYLYQTCYKQPF